ncbi:GNAT family N-acetyltransferase [Thaumasiovibrio sp. DFM-14]|uniref:GNAT family N-acetyltransferase n=1 Tax=Thaumasiovibrio sp. DFM-14 TaxID=3384792 RepID=UPI0039A1BB40
MLIRTENPTDTFGVDALLKEAFPSEAEANLVMALRENGKRTLSFVACDDEGAVIGYILFSPLQVDGEESNWQGLAPLAVSPEYQGQGVASALMRESFASLSELGYPVVAVLGDPKHYRSMGFETASAHGFSCRWPVPDDCFMICELNAGELKQRQGRIEYSDEFNQL